MADVTLLVGTEVVRGLTDRRNAIVTRCTRAKHLCVINGKHGCEYVGGVAVLADVRRLYVCLVLADRIRTVMAAHTVARDVDVIEIRR